MRFRGLPLPISYESIEALGSIGFANRVWARSGRFSWAAPCGSSWGSLRASGPNGSKRPAGPFAVEGRAAVSGGRRDGRT
jgi:hypothetical protein